MRNLLGRLNARSVDSLQRVARFWSVNLVGNDRGRHVGALYRTMTNIRAVRDVWERFDDTTQHIVRELALTEADALSVAAIAELCGLPEEITRDALVELFQAGILAREGDRQELPVGAVPKLFLPREMGLIFRRLQDEIDTGDLSRSSLRIILNIADDAEIEESSTKWGIRVIPGMRRRNELIDDLLRQIPQPERIDRVVHALSRDARSLWHVVRTSEHDGALPYDDAIERVWPNRTRDQGTQIRIREALDELETSLLVLHAYRSDGTRRLFIPQEILHPGRVPTTLPLRPLQPLAPDTVRAPETRHPDALAWDLMTVLREIATQNTPAWAPGEPLARAWQRRLNGRLWFGREEVPPVGYLGFLLTLALGAGLIEASSENVGSLVDRHAIRPVVSGRVRSWRNRSFHEQTAQLIAIWLESDQWIEGREREEIEVWGAEWRGFRHRLLDALASVPTDEWLLIDDLAGRLAEQNPGLIGTTFTAASARSSDDRGDARVAAIGRIISVELETALGWFGLVETSVVSGKGLAARVTSRIGELITEPVATEAASPPKGPVLTISDDGTITLHRPAPLHVWSLTAFADNEQLSPEAIYQLRPGSVGRALGAGFDLDQIVTYLEKQSGASLPESVLTLLRQWTVGYRRVRLRRATVLYPDAETAHDELVRIATDAGLTVLDQPIPDGGLLVLLPESGESGVQVEDQLLITLRNSGYVGQWLTAPARRPSTPDAAPEATSTPTRPAPKRRRSGAT